MKTFAILRIVLAAFCPLFLSPSFALAACKIPDFALFESGSWHIGTPETYSDPKYGVSFPFKGDYAKGTFYIYDFGINAPDRSDAAKQLAYAVQEIEYFQRKMIPDVNLSDPYLVPDVFLDTSRLVEEAVYFTVSTKGQHKVTIASMALLNECFHKIRYTQSVGSKDTDSVMEALKGFYILIHTMQKSLEETTFFE